MTGTPRQRLLEQVAAAIPPAAGDDCVLVAIDGVDGSGKTTFADELAAVLLRAGRHVIRVSGDDFHHIRERRYRQGRESALGFWEDSFDYERLRRDVLDPLSPGGSRLYSPRAHVLETDEVLGVDLRTAPPGATVVLDGLFLHREDLRGYWQLSVLLDVPFTETIRRMHRRDGTSLDAEHPSVTRYRGAQEVYFSLCSPRVHASLIVDNTDVDNPRLTHA